MEKRKTSNLERKRKIFHFFMILYVDKSHTHRKTKEKKDSAKSCLTHVTPWTVARQAPLSMGFFRQEYCSVLPFPSPGDFPNPGIELSSPAYI